MSNSYHLSQIYWMILVFVVKRSFKKWALFTLIFKKNFIVVTICFCMIDNLVSYKLFVIKDL